jgi:hypothetical protein
MIAFVAVGGSSDLHKYAFECRNEHTRRAAYVLVYRLYEPGRWRNPNIGLVYENDPDPSAKFSISFSKSEVVSGSRNAGAAAIQRATTTTGEVATRELLGLASQRVWVPDYVCVFGSATFRTRTHVFIHQPPKSPHNDDRGSLLIPKVLKAQLCPTDARCDESTALEHIHSLQTVPGVIRLVYQEQLDVILVAGRVQKHLGLDQQGGPFMSIETPIEMLMVIYDVLESEFALCE